MTWNLPPLRRLIVAISSPPATLSDSTVANPGLLRTSNLAVPASSEIVKRSGHHPPDIAYPTDAVLCVGPGVVEDGTLAPPGKTPGRPPSSHLPQAGDRSCHRTGQDHRAIGVPLTPGRDSTSRPLMGSSLRSPGPFLP